jgi:hypothetical protein
LNRNWNSYMYASFIPIGGDFDKGASSRYKKTAAISADENSSGGRPVKPPWDELSGAVALADFREALRAAARHVAVQADSPVVPEEPDALIAAGAVFPAGAAAQAEPLGAVVGPDVPVGARVVIQAVAAEPDA